MTDVIPHVNDMEDDIFHKHADKRHADDFGAPFEDFPNNTEYTTDVARATHDYWHRERPEMYDHIHLEEER